MMKLAQRKIETFIVKVNVTKEDIEIGKCRDTQHCMEIQAVDRALTELLGSKVEHLRLDGAQIKFNFNGFRYYATTPKTPKVNLIRFDLKKHVGPHHYKVEFIKGTKIRKESAERQHQINLARKARVAAGIPDKKPAKFTLHQRVVGLGAV